MSCVVWIVLFILFFLATIGLVIGLFIILRRPRVVCPAIDTLTCPVGNRCCPDARCITPALINNTYRIYGFTSALASAPTIANARGDITQGNITPPATFTDSSTGQDVYAGFGESAPAVVQWKFISTNGDYYLVNAASGYYLAVSPTQSSALPGVYMADLVQQQSNASLIDVSNISGTDLYVITATDTSGNIKYLTVAGQSDNNFIVKDNTLVFVDNLANMATITPNYLWLLQPVA